MAVAAFHDVLAVAECRPVVDDDVTEEVVIFGPAGDGVVVRAAGNGVVAGVAEQTVVPGPAVDGVVVHAAGRGVAAGAAEHGVVARVAEQTVVAAAPFE